MNKSLIRLVKCAFLGIGFGAIGLIINRVIYLSLLPWTRATTWDAIRDFVILLISFFLLSIKQRITHRKGANFNGIDKDE